MEGAVNGRLQRVENSVKTLDGQRKCGAGALAASPSIFTTGSADEGVGATNEVGVTLVI
jgi:hypothetical protein